jgi:hypothetical protein
MPDASGRACSVSSYRQNSLTVRLDRVQWVCWAGPGWRPPNLPGFRVVFDHRIRPRGKTPTYGRCRKYQSLTNDTKVFWYYQRQRGWLRPWKVILVADDEQGLRAADVHIAMRHCKFVRLIAVELALDFCPSAMNQTFVHCHAIFGKSQRRKRPAFPVMYFGSRRGPVLIRIYLKKELKVFRIEGEFHSPFLRRHRVDTEQDISIVADEFYPAHIRFVKIDWKRLLRYLIKKHSRERALQLLRSARKRRASIRRVSRYLRRKGVLNVHRFYCLLAINKEIKRALKKWSFAFDYAWQMARQKTDRGER